MVLELARRGLAVRAPGGFWGRFLLDELLWTNLTSVLEVLVTVQAPVGCVEKTLGRGIVERFGNLHLIP